MSDPTYRVILHPNLLPPYSRRADQGLPLRVAERKAREWVEFGLRATVEPEANTDRETTDE